MTPEERAQQAIDAVEERTAKYVMGHPYLRYKGIDADLVKEVAAAIRAAEADVRERCAKIAADYAGTPDYTCGPSISAAIRAQT